jgi:hypothetical protein
MICGFVFILVFGLLGQPEACAQTGNQGPPADTAPKVIGVTGHLKLGNIITIEVENLSSWAAKNDPRKLVPYLNGRELAGVYPDAIHISHNMVLFHMERTPGSMEAWADLLRYPVLLRPVTVTTGLENQSPFDTVVDRGHPLPLTVIPRSWGAISITVVAVCLIVFVWLARTTNIIREPGTTRDEGKRPYSLGRAQMAFWFFLIFSAYLCIWLILGDLDTITESLLGLMGISAATAIGGAVIDSSKLGAKASQLQTLAAEKAALEARVAEIKSQLSKLDERISSMQPDANAADITNRAALSLEAVQKEFRLDQVGQEITALSGSMTRSVSVNFLTDVLSEGNTQSFHRFQIFAWTIVLGIIFVASVYNNLAMPQFSPTLLGLMGISAGTYLGFKFPEE